MTGIQTLKEGTLIAFEAISANKLRTTLTILAVAIGVAVVVLIAALFTGLRASVAESFEAVSPSTFFVARFDLNDIRLTDIVNDRPPWGDKPPITNEEAYRLSRLPAVDEAVVDFELQASVSFEGNRADDIPASADSEGWIHYTAGDFIAGRNFTRGEVAHARAVIIISVPLAEELFGQRDPLGRRIRVRVEDRGPSEMFTVIGVFEIEENIFSAAVRHWVVFPWTAAVKRLRANRDALSVGIVPVEAVTEAEAQDQVIALLRSMRGLRPAEENNFALMKAQQILDLFNQFTGVFFAGMILLSSGALVVGGIGVIGIMLISVTERTREIGIRKALGATQREILWQFLVEASALTLLGGTAGLIFGGGVALLIAATTPVPAAIPLWSVVMALTTAALTGILFGLVPAYRASKLDPVAALGYEH